MNFELKTNILISLATLMTCQYASQRLNFDSEVNSKLSISYDFSRTYNNLHTHKIPLWLTLSIQFWLNCFLCPYLKGLEHLRPYKFKCLSVLGCTLYLCDISNFCKYSYYILSWRANWVTDHWGSSSSQLSFPIMLWCCSPLTNGGHILAICLANPHFAKWFLLSYVLFICIESFITGLSWGEECEACRSSK